MPCGARDVAALRDVDLHVMYGEAIGIAGESGSGKIHLGAGRDALFGAERRYRKRPYFCLKIRI